MESTFSLLWLFTGADLMTRFISIVLAIASITSWAIMIEKSLALRAAKLASALFERRFWSGGSLDALYSEMEGEKSLDPMSAIFASAMREWRKSSSILKKKGGAKSASLLERLRSIMEITEDREISMLEERLNLLAIVGSTSPLLGLFGTVWGIMESFGAIGASGGNSLNVIAPGVAVALSTTALGLIAAIPAVIGYNKIYGDIGRYSAKLEAFQAEFSAIISRQIDENANG